MRAIIGLPLGDAEGAVESSHGSGASIQVDEELTYLDGSTVQHGHAATMKLVEYEGPDIREDGDIYDTEHTHEKWVGTEWFADLEDTGFMAVDSSDGEFAFNMAGRMAGCMIERAMINLEAFVDQLQQQDAVFEWLGWSEGDEAGVYYVDEDDIDGRVRDRALSQLKTHLGFRYRWDGARVRGTISQSGYAEAWSLNQADIMARWLRDEVLPHAEIPDEEVSA